MNPDDLRLVFTGEFPREFKGVGVFQPGQRTKIYRYMDPGNRQAVDYLLSTGLFQPYDSEAEAIVTETVDKLKAEAEARAAEERERSEAEARAAEAKEREKAEAKMAEEEATKPVPPEALAKIKDRKKVILVAGN